MKTGLRVFLNSAVFGIVIAIGYWFSSRHPGGTILLALMGVAMCFATGFILFAERNAQLSGDQKDTDQRAVREDLGVFTTSTIWPLAAALSVFFLVLGIIWSSLVAGSAVVALLLVLWRLGAESNRTAKR